jgi:hypothetical protein
MIRFVQSSQKIKKKKMISIGRETSKEKLNSMPNQSKLFSLEIEPLVLNSPAKDFIQTFLASLLGKGDT